MIYFTDFNVNIFATCQIHNYIIKVKCKAIKKGEKELAACSEAAVFIHVSFVLFTLVFGCCVFAFVQLIFLLINATFLHSVLLTELLLYHAFLYNFFCDKKHETPFHGMVAGDIPLLC